MKRPLHLSGPLETGVQRRTTRTAMQKEARFYQLELTTKIGFATSEERVSQRERVREKEKRTIQSTIFVHILYFMYIQRYMYNTSSSLT